MNKNFLLLTAAIFLLCCSQSFGQKLPTVKKEVIEHYVYAGETVYGLAKKYKVTEKQILQANNGKPLKADETILIPVKYIEHKVKKGETFYGIAKKYHLMVEDVESAEGVEEMGLCWGTTIKIFVK